MTKSLHQTILEEGHSLVERVFEESSNITIEQVGENQGFLMLSEGDRTERLVDRKIRGYQIERGDDVPEAMPLGCNPEEFKKRFVVYVGEI